MKFLIVVMWVISLKFAFTTASDLNETYNLINSTNLAKPGCKTRCGDLIVPYPFGVGMGSNCSISTGFDIHCNTLVNPPRASRLPTSHSSIKLISDSTIRISNSVSSRCTFLDGSSNGFRYLGNYTHGPYTFSDLNKFILIGCDGYAWLTSETKSRNVSTGCMVLCSGPEGVVGGECTGNGCCQSSIPQGINYFETKVGKLVNSSNVNYTKSYAPCTYAFIGEESAFKFNGITDINATDVNASRSFIDRIEASVPKVLEWAIGNLSCAEARVSSDFACQANSTCVDSARETRGYRCVCKDGYQGNPYLSPGCKGTAHEELHDDLIKNQKLKTKITKNVRLFSLP